MPRLGQPRSLEELALAAVGSFVAVVGRAMVGRSVEPNHIRCKEEIIQETSALHDQLRHLNELLYANVPWYLFDQLAYHVLSAVALLIKETKTIFSERESIRGFINHMNVVVSLTEVAVHPSLKRIDFSLWPKIVRHVLYKNLTKMTGLENLDLGSGSGGWKTSDIEKYIMLGIGSMNNLTSLCLCFDCTDQILNLVGLHCSRLQVLDVTSSRSVTDKSVHSLVRCVELRNMYMYRTSITIDGYAKLLLKLPKLEDLGRCNNFGRVLEHISAFYHHKEPLGLKTFQSKDVSNPHLKLLVEMCPQVSQIALYHDTSVGDLSLLAALNELRELRLLSCDFYADHVKELLERRGGNLTKLQLEHVDEIDLNALKYISQFCPKLKTLGFYNCEFRENISLVPVRVSLPLFEHLEKITCIADCTLIHLDFLLAHCTNIRHIHLGSSTGIGDETMGKVLLSNPMTKLEELRILYSDNLSMQTVQLLMVQCHSLCVLSELESWQGISRVELSTFRKTILENNIDLDTSPTLSY